jgi:cytochrome c biogenesis protein
LKEIILKHKQSISEQIWQFFASAKLAVTTLVLLALSSVLGTLLLQNGPEQEYIRRYGSAGYQLIKTLNLNDMYHAWWFLGLIMLLCINLIVCSFERLSSTWKIIFPKKISFNPEQFRKSKNLESFSFSKTSDTFTDDIEKLLTGKIGPVTKKEDGNTSILYAEKGRWTRLGAYIVHISILLLLIGALIGAVFGFKGWMQLNEGENSDMAMLYSGNTQVKLDFAVQCNDFEVKFYDTGRPEEFRSNLTILEDGKEILTKDIKVNHPLQYKGINIFQSSYGTASPGKATFELIRQSDGSSMTQTLEIGQEITLSDEATLFKLEGFIPHFDFNGNDLGNAFVGMITEANGDKYRIGLPLRFSSFDKMRKGSFSIIIKDFEQRYYTGLQITKDPGVWYVYAGFLIMIIGCWISFFMSHQRYYIEIVRMKKQSVKVHIAATANRGGQGMKPKVLKLLNAIKGIK